MKRIYQSGGVVSYTPFIPNSGTANTTSSSSGSTEKQEKITGTLQKEIVDVLKENGIQSDVDTFLSQANAFLNKSQHLSSMSLFGGQSDDYSMTDLIQILSMANKVKQNKAQYDTATDRLKTQDAWNEVAVSNDGKIYVYSEEGLRTVSADEYHKNRDKYQALTNSQVLGLREQDSNLAFNSNVLRDMSGALGLKTITTQLMDTVSKFGTMSRTEYTKNTGDAISQSAWDGMQILLGEGPQGYYKATTKSEKENIQSALRYLWSSLGTDGQARLRAETAVSGGDPSRNQYDLLLQTIEHHTDFEQSVDFDKTATEYDPDGDGKGTNPGDALTEGTLAMEVARGNLTEITAYMSPVAQRVGDKAMMAFKAWNAGQLQDKQGDVLHANNLQDLLPNIEQAKAADTSTIVFGNQLLSSQDVAGVVWDGTSLATRVALPKKYVNGKQVPDFDLMVKLNELNTWISDNPGVTNLEIQNKMKELTSEGIYFDSNTKRYTISSDRMGFFLSFAAYCSDDLIDIADASKPFLHKLSRKDGKQLKHQFNNYVQYGKATPGKKEKQKNGFESSEAGDFYYGNIYIPIVDPLQATITTTNQYYPKSTFMDSSKQAELGQQILSAQQQSNWKFNF